MSYVPLPSSLPDPEFTDSDNKQPSSTKSATLLKSTDFQSINASSMDRPLLNAVLPSNPNLPQKAMRSIDIPTPGRKLSVKTSNEAQSPESVYSNLSLPEQPRFLPPSRIPTNQSQLQERTITRQPSPPEYRSRVYPIIPGPPLALRPSVRIAAPVQKQMRGADALPFMPASGNGSAVPDIPSAVPRMESRRYVTQELERYAYTPKYDQRGNYRIPSQPISRLTAVEAVTPFGARSGGSSLVPPGGNFAGMERPVSLRLGQQWWHNVRQAAGQIS